MNKNKWIELKPIGYVGLALGLGGIIGPILFGKQGKNSPFQGMMR